MRTRSAVIPFGAAVLAVAMVGTGGVGAHATTHPTTGAAQHVIVLLRDQHTATPASRADVAARERIVRADQAPLESSIARLGGRTTRAFAALDAVAATVPAGSLAALRADPSVGSVVPDLTWHLSVPARDTAVAGATADRTGPTTVGSKICPTGSTPLLQPEALPLTHTASDAPGAQTARSLGYTGAGVKVAFIADGLDVNQPDFIRADGTHVFVDYKDFSGDGTASDSNGEEAFGDASAIAAQGRKSYDLSKYVSTAHPLPRGCDIRVEGMAPGASLVGLKIFSNELLTAPTSTIIEAIDYAVTVDHVDVINESFGSNPYPDNASDPVSAFNKMAVEAGVTVVASDGDAGIGSTLGTASTDPYVIGAGASTSEQSYAQQDSYAFQLGNGRYTSNEVSALSSAGISQTNRVQDLLAPGDLSWALCSTKRDGMGGQMYSGCTNDRGEPSNIVDFGGTSQSAPLTSGASALVIEAYREHHAGASPTPAQVRQVLDSSADDLTLPADEQGAGLLDTYRAVRLAAALGNPPAAAPGSGLLLGATQLDTTAPAGSTVTRSVAVTNASSATQTVTTGLRAITEPIGHSSATVQLSALDPVATFIDGFGSRRSYVKTTFTVPAGTDRLLASLSTVGTPVGSPARFSLLNPQGTYTAYTLPQGPGDFGHVDVHEPMAGTWTAIVWTGASTAGYNGPATLDTVDYAAVSAGTVSPAAFTLSPGQHAKVTVTTTAPASDAVATSLVLDPSAGPTTTMPVVIRAVETVSAGHPVSIAGTFTAANGRDFSPGQTFTYLVDVPAGAQDLDVDVATTGAPPNLIVAHLSDPTGEPTATDLNAHLSGTDIVTDTGVQIVHARPMAGRWQLTLELANPVAGAPLPQDFSGTVALDQAHVTARGVPSGSSVSKAAGTDATVTIYNTSPQAQTYFVDPRSSRTATYPLVAVPPAVSSDPYTAEIAAPLQSDSDLPSWYVPTEVSTLAVNARAASPIDLDMMALDNLTAINSPSSPDVEAATAGTDVQAKLSTHEVVSSLWAAFPTPVGPAPRAGTPPVDVQLVATVRAAAFATGITSSTGDPLLATVSATATGFAPVTIPAGGHATVTVHVGATGAIGSSQAGTLYVDTLSPFGPAGNSSLGDEVAAIPYAFTVAP